tara:strand:+ start:225 stop:773 length:549 start_codon:yes stop_codon:yes gene_type:complete
MFIKRILKIGLVAIVASALTTVQAQRAPKPGKGKPTKEKSEKGGKKWDSEKVKGRLKVAFEKRNKHRGDARKRGSKVRDRKKGNRKDSGFGKLVRDDARIKELKKAFAAAAKKQKGVFDRDAWRDATDEEKKALREKISASRKGWTEQMKAHRKEVSARIKEIGKEFKNNRDKVIGGNDSGN